MYVSCIIAGCFGLRNVSKVLVYSGILCDFFFVNDLTLSVEFQDLRVVLASVYSPQTSVFNHS